MRRRMNVYITTGRRNLKYAYVAIKSLFMNNKMHEIYLYVVSEDLTMEDMAYEQSLAREFGHQIIILRFDENTAGQYIQIDSSYHWPIGTMSSYWLFHELLPADVDRIIVIESDTVITGDLGDIYFEDFDGAYVICPAPEHKPENHRNFMERTGGETLTFVSSLYDVPRIRNDFTLQDILEKDEKVKKLAGFSQMEFTFGLLFKEHVKYVPGKTSCIDENERYMEELGYDYITECEKTAKIIHFSSYSDYGKPWNPVSLMPGYFIWWEYAKGSPYYKEYFTEQWKIYGAVREKQEKVKKNISYRNLLLSTLVLFTMAVTVTVCVVAKSLMLAGVIVLELAGAGMMSVCIRKGLICIRKSNNNNNV